MKRSRCVKQCSIATGLQLFNTSSPNGFGSASSNTLSHTHACTHSSLICLHVDHKRDGVKLRFIETTFVPPRPLLWKRATKTTVLLVGGHAVLPFEISEKRPGSCAPSRSCSRCAGATVPQLLYPVIFNLLPRLRKTSSGSVSEPSGNGLSFLRKNSTLASSASAGGFKTSLQTRLSAIFTLELRTLQDLSLRADFCVHI